MSQVAIRSLRGFILGVILFSALTGLAPALERLAVAKSKLIDPMWAVTAGENAAVIDHGPWTAFLSAYVKQDQWGVARVAYGDVTASDRAALDGYLAMLQATDPQTLSRDGALAFWINLYNARTVALILDHYPLESIRQIKFSRFATGPWGEPLVTVNGRELSLNDIESGIIRPVWDDARMHYAVNCAAVSCPNLAGVAYEAETLDAQLDAAARAFINNFRGAHIDGRGRLTASKIFAWYREDWGGSEADIVDELRRYADDDLKAALEGRRSINRYAYDWALNDQALADSFAP